MIKVRRSRRGRPIPRSSGFSMIEVLVALLILAIGLLGFALLQTMNLRYTQSANTRTVATNLAYELVDHIRASRLSQVDFTAAGFPVGGVTQTDCDRPLGTVPVTGADSITAEWQCRVVQMLGSQASAQITVNSGLVRITLNWGERFDADSNTSFLVETRL